MNETNKQDLEQTNNATTVPTNSAQVQARHGILNETETVT